MRIHRSAHSRSYTVVSNAVLQDNQLSFVARGVLGYLLSLRDGTRVDVRVLARLCKTGREQISGALNELKARGYYAVERVQETGGQWVTRTVVREDPQAAPAAGKPDAGEPDAGISGRTPEGESTGGKLPPTPGRPPAAAEPGTDTRGGTRADTHTDTRVGTRGKTRAKTGAKTGADSRTRTGARPGEARAAPLTREDAALVRRIGRVEPRLCIGEAEAGRLVPLFAQWRERGVEDSALVHAVTAGLPQWVAAPAGFVASRLVRRLPPAAAARAGQPPVDVRAPIDVRAPVRPTVRVHVPVRPPECADCARPLPVGGQERCRACEGPVAGGEEPWGAIARNGRARVRAALAGAAADEPVRTPTEPATQPVAEAVAGTVAAGPA